MTIAAFIFGTIGLQHYLLLAALMFVCGLLTILVKRNAIGILMGVELILNAANVNLVAFNAFSHGGSGAALKLDGQVFAIFVIATLVSIFIATRPNRNGSTASPC